MIENGTIKNRTLQMKFISDIPKKETYDTILVKQDYHFAYLSRQMSLTGKKEVNMGKSNFGVFGDGKEIAQLSMARNFKKGDWRSGYYRDQTFMLVTGMISPEDYFAQLYGTVDEKKYPVFTGRSFNNHFATSTVDKEGNWQSLSQLANSSSDISPTGGQMPRLLGLAYASKLFRNNKSLGPYKHLSLDGNEVAFGTIGESGTSEGVFFETINAACVLQVPLAVAVWDDGYGISVPVELQTAKSSISEVLEGFRKKDAKENGCLIFKARGWDYPTLNRIFKEGISICREKHIPVIFHITEMTQPLGHSSSGSHERYKPAERLAWEKEHDPVKMLRNWILDNHIAREDELLKIEENVKKLVHAAKEKAWQEYINPIQKEKNDLLNLLRNHLENPVVAKRKNEINYLKNDSNCCRKDLITLTKKMIYDLSSEPGNNLRKDLSKWASTLLQQTKSLYNNHLQVENHHSALAVKEVKPEFGSNPVKVKGNDILRENFHYIFDHNPLVVTFGEDTGKLGDVNRSLDGLQEKHGDLRVTDTGIREQTIIGQGVGLAIRGLRPIAEIQYLDYLLYGIQTLSDDVATLTYRTGGRQVAPLIVRTRGHRLIGIWHSGSPLGMIINSVRGMHVCVPRNMTQAAGFYNTLLESHDPAIVIEPLKAYHTKEFMPENIGKFKVPLGIPEIIEPGHQVTLVTYGWCVEIAKEAVNQLHKLNISVELIDVQTLLPFDIHGIIKESIKKTNHLVLLDEDVPGGATAFMLQQIMEEQKSFYYLDAPPITITAQAHRPAYGMDGDYVSKPNAEDVIETIYNMMNDHDPTKYPALFQVN